VLGKYVAMSVVQGGPGFPYFLQAVYKYITTGDYLNTYVDDRDIPDEGVRRLISEVNTRILKDFADIITCIAQNCWK